jgi:hypothetical protein
MEVNFYVHFPVKLGDMVVLDTQAHETTPQPWKVAALVAVRTIDHYGNPVDFAEVVIESHSSFGSEQRQRVSAHRLRPFKQDVSIK